MCERMEMGWGRNANESLPPRLVTYIYNNGEWNNYLMNVSLVSWTQNNHLTCKHSRDFWAILELQVLPYVILVRPSAVEEDEVKGGKSPFLHRTCAVLETRASTCFCFFFTKLQVVWFVLAARGEGIWRGKHLGPTSECSVRKESLGEFWWGRSWCGN